MSFARRSQGVYLLALGMLLFLPQWGEARPEFANRHGINRCTACHFSPAGGGLRNTNGKLYGAHGFQISKYASQDFVSADMRFVHYNPAGKEDKRSGLFLMAGLIGGSVAITPEEINTEVRAVVSHDVLNQSNWDSYVRFRRYTDTETGWLPQYIVFGRFHAPFGLLTDEHRTYTKMQTLSDYNTKMEAGLMVSGQPLDSLHYDFAVVNGEASSAELNDGQAELYGGISNLRYISSSQWLPLTLGVSHKFYDRVPGQKNPWAAAAYTIFSMERLTGGWLNMDIMFEYAQAKNLNEVATARA